MTQFEALARKFERLVPKVVTAANKAGQLTVQDARSWAIYFSSGTFSTAQLVEMNHPYGIGMFSFSQRLKGFGRRGPIPYGDPSIINTQSGQFRSDWVTYVGIGNASDALGLVAWGIKNTAPYASYLQFGTVKMIKRPLDVGLRAYMDQVYAKRIVDSVVPVIQYALAA